MQEPGADDGHEREGCHFEAQKEHEHAEEHVTVTVGEGEESRGRPSEEDEQGAVHDRVCADQAWGDDERPWVAETVEERRAQEGGGAESRSGREVDTKKQDAHCRRSRQANHEAFKKDRVSPHASVSLGRALPSRTRRLPLEAGKNGLEEGVLD